MKRCQVKLNVLIFYEIVYFFTLYTCSKHLYLAQKLFTKAKNYSKWLQMPKVAEKLPSTIRTSLRTARAPCGWPTRLAVLCRLWNVTRMPACQWTLAANPRRLETENRPPLLVERKTERYLLKLFDHYFLNWGKMKHLKGKNLSNKPCTAL